jgi:hypothetical protein
VTEPSRWPRFDADWFVKAALIVAFVLVLNYCNEPVSRPADNGCPDGLLLDMCVPQEDPLLDDGCARYEIETGLDSPCI